MAFVRLGGSWTRLVTGDKIAASVARSALRTLFDASPCRAARLSNVQQPARPPVLSLFTPPARSSRSARSPPLLLEFEPCVGAALPSLQDPTPSFWLAVCAPGTASCPSTGAPGLNATGHERAPALVTGERWCASASWVPLSAPSTFRLIRKHLVVLESYSLVLGDGSSLPHSASPSSRGSTSSRPSPTDPILAAVVVGGKYADKHVPTHIRHLLAAESGCNDGAAFPSSTSRSTPPRKTRSATGSSSYQVILGVVIGFAFRYMMKFSERHSLIDRHSYVAQYVSLALLTIGLTTLLGSDDLLNAFACGATFTWDGFFNR
ncbi:hypothetical protein B0H17DRAFT_1198162 [Mycena rosella]|uniref:Cation/H+ exchanger transmembrane domain-containing protein n=1 Tax=Mycena rosella TaxID=1033263 RepID=A0AAD7GL90_MYCRO|nr:hypothetical protein B0H17DRAFT_1198162 [Mycena rosella]